MREFSLTPEQEQELNKAAFETCALEYTCQIGEE